jgi:hypothetical protein
LPKKLALSPAFLEQLDGFLVLVVGRRLAKYQQQGSHRRQPARQRVHGEDLLGLPAV